MSLVTKLVWVDVLFTENPSDLNVYLDGGLTGCCEAISVPTDIGDLNELASEYRATNVSFDLISPAFKRVLPNLCYKEWQLYCRQLGTKIRPQGLVGCVSGFSIIRGQLEVRRGRGSHQKSETWRERCGGGGREEK